MKVIEKVYIVQTNITIQKQQKTWEKKKKYSKSYCHSHSKANYPQLLPFLALKTTTISPQQLPTKKVTLKNNSYPQKIVTLKKKRKNDSYPQKKQSP